MEEQQSDEYYDRDKSEDSPRRHKKRVRNWTSDDRARHREFEKGRREAFNDSLMSLAHLLPSLADAKESRLTKHVIVGESLKYHRFQEAKLSNLEQRMACLLAERNELLAEVNDWRRSLSLPVKDAFNSAPAGVVSTDVDVDVSRPTAPRSGLEPFPNDASAWQADNRETFGTSSLKSGIAPSGLPLDVTQLEGVNEHHVVDDGLHLHPPAMPSGSTMCQSVPVGTNAALEDPIQSWNSHNSTAPIDNWLVGMNAEDLASVYDAWSTLQGQDWLSDFSRDRLWPMEPSMEAIPLDSRYLGL